MLYEVITIDDQLEAAARYTGVARGVGCGGGKGVIALGQLAGRRIAPFPVGSSSGGSYNFV